MTPTRGERNSNPGNIERNYVNWQGMAEDQTDTRFIVFKTPEDGIRALGKLLLTYYRKHGHNTVRAIIERYAPSIENDTTAYLEHVAKQLSVTPDTPIKPDNPEALAVLVRAIIQHENGRVSYTDEQIKTSVERALA